MTKQMDTLWKDCIQRENPRVAGQSASHFKYGRMLSSKEEGYSFKILLEGGDFSAF